MACEFTSTQNLKHPFELLLMGSVLEVHGVERSQSLLHISTHYLSRLMNNQARDNLSVLEQFMLSYFLI